jgi:hypothetical protein
MTTITLPRAVIEQAFEALNTAWSLDPDGDDGYYLDAIAALRAALEQPQAEPAPAPKLIGWRTDNFLWETDDIKKAKSWEPNIGVLPIFEGDPHTRLTPPGAAATADRTTELEALLREARDALNGCERGGCIMLWMSLIARIDVALGGKP